MPIPCDHDCAGCPCHVTDPDGIETPGCLAVGRDGEEERNLKKINWDRFDRGSKQIQVEGCVGGRRERLQVIEDAIVAIQKDGATALSSRYMGVKNYAAFGDQREDHEYGYGPAHGAIVFRVGRRNKNDTVLDSDAVYMLEVLRDTAPVPDDLVQKSGLNPWKNNIQDLRGSQLQIFSILEAQQSYLEAQQVDASDEGR